MKRLTTILGTLFLASVLFSSCTTVNKTIREPDARVRLEKEDFTLSDQVSAQAKSTTIVGIDFGRLFRKETGNVEGGKLGIGPGSLPIIGNVISDQTANYALFKLLTNNEGYDVIFYPQYRTKVVKPILGIGFLTKITTVNTKARLGKLK